MKEDTGEKVGRGLAKAPLWQAWHALRRKNATSTKKIVPTISPPVSQPTKASATASRPGAAGQHPCAVGGWVPVRARRWGGGGASQYTAPARTAAASGGAQRAGRYAPAPNLHWWAARELLFPTVGPAGQFDASALGASLSRRQTISVAMTIFKVRGHRYGVVAKRGVFSACAGSDTQA